MLHVMPTMITAAPPAFCPIFYLACMRESGVQVHAREACGSDPLAWELPSDGPTVLVRNSADPRLDIDGDADGQRKVWEVLRAEEYIAGARQCGLLLVPALSSLGDRNIAHFGFDEDGNEDFDGASERFFINHPASRALDHCKERRVFDVVCAEIGVTPEDPNFLGKVCAYFTGEIWS